MRRRRRRHFSRPAQRLGATRDSAKQFNVATGHVCQRNSTFARSLCAGVILGRSVEVVASQIETFGNSHFRLFSVRYMSSTVRLSVCLSSVTFVHPTQAIVIFSNVSTPCGTLTIRDLCIKFFTEIVPGEPLRRGLNQRAKER